MKIAVGGFVDNNYWSSSEYDANNAWNQNFNNGNQNNNNKNNTNYVRPVRGFQRGLLMTAWGSSPFTVIFWWVQG